MFQDTDAMSEWDHLVNHCRETMSGLRQTLCFGGSGLGFRGLGGSVLCFGGSGLGFRGFGGSVDDEWIRQGWMSTPAQKYR